MVRVREDRSVQSRACNLALDVTCDRQREVLDIWWQDSEAAKFWLAVLNDLRRRGIQDVLIACVDGLKGFPDAIEATFAPNLGTDLDRPPDQNVASLRQLPR
jgi:transposase-like protein